MYIYIINIITRADKTISRTEHYFSTYEKAVNWWESQKSYTIKRAKFCEGGLRVILNQVELDTNQVETQQTLLKMSGNELLQQ